jgi:uncharacterized protein with NRDE domain
MCLILFAHGVAPRFPLVVVANRDEFHQRPTAPAAFWTDAPNLLAGRDLLAGGTWMGITRTGRWAALTNFRDPAPPPPGLRSRGHLVGEYLRGDGSAAAYAAAVLAERDRYPGFNLVLGDGTAVRYLGNRTAAGSGTLALPPGVYGLSNHLLDTPWPKVVQGKRRLAALLRGAEALEEERLFEILASTDPAPDEQLPDTGVGREWERVLSSLFIVSPTYGTRASTVLLVHTSGVVTFAERSFRPGPAAGGEVRYRFTIDTDAAP